jgi:hypothetical protein
MENIQNIQNKSTHRVISIIGAIGGFVSIEHGFFELMHGNVPTNGIQIEAIDSAMRFEGGVGEMALTLIPNFLITGIAAVLIGISLIVWSTFFIGRKHGALGFFGLSVLSLLLGGGVAYFNIALLNCIAATRINKPLTWWQNNIPERTRIPLAKNWKTLLFSFVILFGFTLAIAIFGLSFIGIDDVNSIALSLGLLSMALQLISYLACFSSDSMLR